MYLHWDGLQLPVRYRVTVPKKHIPAEKRAELSKFIRSHLEPKQESKKFVLFVKHGCPFCKKATDLLNDHNIKFEVVSDSDPINTAYLIGKKGLPYDRNHRTWPRIYFGEKFVGGFDDLHELLGPGRGQKEVEGKF